MLSSWHQQYSEPGWVGSVYSCCARGHQFGLIMFALALLIEMPLLIFKISLSSQSFFGALLMYIVAVCTLLTPWRLGGFGNFRKKNSSFRLPYQRLSSSADCARELFNGSNGSASLVDCTRKKILPGGCRFFMSDVISEVVLGSFWLMLPGLGPNH